uniref:Sulfotransferase domain-containing protein n=1 Tax=Timema genevievae TaxID=629358 RepID=A0A7R9K2H1_TIMGE|nr:unnamed protein product [Timema genevievae]
MSAFPLEIRDVNSEVNKKLLKDFTGERTGFLQVGPDKWFMPSKFRHEADKYYNMAIRPDDTWVVAFPRSGAVYLVGYSGGLVCLTRDFRGTTMVQEILWLLSNNLDYESAYRVPQMQRFPFLEFSTFIHEQAKVEFMSQNAMDPKKQAILGMVALPGYEVLGYVPSPRFIKTHLPFSLLPPNLLESGAKVVYIARNPKDVAVSCYHFKRLVQAFGYTGDFASYWDYFEKNQLPWAPYWAHINEGWKRRHQPNVLFLFYEDINKDLPGTVRKVAQFLNKSLSEEQVAQMSQHLNIENFRRNPAVNMDFLKEVGLLNSGEQSFIRKGGVGGWTNEFTPELNQRADRWIHEHLKNTDIRFPSTN